MNRNKTTKGYEDELKAGVSDKFFKLLKNVPGSDDDFVYKVLLDIKNGVSEFGITEFVRLYPEANATDILEYAYAQKKREKDIKRFIDKYSQTAETKELRRLLENVSDTYDDFVCGVLLDVRNWASEKEIIEFIKNNPEADTSDILEYIDEQEGI